MVTDSSLITMGAHAFGQAQFGSLNAMVAGSIKEAIALARHEPSIQA